MVYNNDHIAGTLIETDNGGFEFTYMESYLNDPAAAAISVHFPKTPKIYI
jgi:HipA-like protein